MRAIFRLLAIGRFSVLLLLGAVACGSREDASSTRTPQQGAAGLRLEPGDVAIEYLAHAAFRIHSAGGSKILIDPFASQVWLGYDFPDSVATDAVLITHPHYDHDAGDFRGLPFPWDSTIPVLRDPGTYAVGEFTIEGVRGKHADPYGMEFGQTNTIWMIEVAGIRIAHLGDNRPITDANVREMGRVDVLMIPIDADYHIIDEAAIQLARSALKPLVLIPMHYRIPDLESSEDSPSDLGEIEPWLVGKDNVNRVGGHLEIFRRETLPDAEQVVVFDHSPKVLRLRN